ncbi:MAG TPA: ABC transporter permease [Bacillota bacterium]
MTVFTVNRNSTGILSVLLVVAGWQWAATRLNLPLILPTPAATGACLVELVQNGDFWRHLGTSLGRGLTGFGIAFGAGAGMGFLAGRFDWVSGLLRPLTVMIRSTPAMTLIILALLWFKGGTVPLFVIFLVVFPLVVENIETGVRHCNPELLEMLKLYRVKKIRRLLVFYLPELLPFLGAAAAAGLGISWKVLIAAEVLACPEWGIGTRLDTARVYLQTDQVFAWTALVVLIGFCFDCLVDQLLRKPFVGWKGDQHVPG